MLGRGAVKLTFCRLGLEFGGDRCSNGLEGLLTFRKNKYILGNRWKRHIATYIDPYWVCMIRLACHLSLRVSAGLPNHKPYRNFSGKLLQYEKYIIRLLHAHFQTNST